MRNLKRALSLGMTAAMISGMMVTAGAASYPDVTSSQNLEAIEVLKAVSVMTGDENGNFNPEKNVTRAEMAVVMANMLKLDVDYYTGAKLTFTDVPEWAVKYVAACQANGIIAGYDEKTFGANDSVTAAQAGLMMMKALGYFQFQQDFGTDWQLATIKQASKIDLFKGVDAAATAALTRNEVAQLALNTLEATMVETDGSNTTITAGDITINTGDTKYVEVTMADGSYGDAIDGTMDGTKDIVQLGEKLFEGKLTNKNGASSDDFGRPGFTWQYDNEDVYFVADEATLTYTSEVETDDMEKALKNYAYDEKLADDRDSAAEIAGLTGNGKLVEIYADSEKEVTDVVVVAYNVGEITGITTGKKNADGSVYTEYTVKNLDTNSSKSYKVYTEAKKDEADDIVVYNGIVKGDIVTFTTDNNGDAYVYATAKVLGTQTSKKGDVITVSGKQYTVANGVAGVSAFDNTDEDNYYYIDQYGYAVYTNAVEAPTQYAVINGIVKEGGLNTKVTAQLIFADGTTKDVTIDSIVEEDGSSDALANVTTDVENTTYNTIFENIVYTYVINDDGNYELTAVKTGDDSAAVQTVSTTKGNPVVGSVTTDNKTTFVVKTVSDSGKDKFTAYTGYQNMPTISSGASMDYAKKDGRVEFVYIDAEGCTVVENSADSTMVYIVDKDTYVVEGTGSNTTYIYDAIVDGEATTISAKTSEIFTAEALYKVTEVNKDGVVTAADKQGDAGDDYSWVAAANIKNDAKNGVLETTGKTYTYDDETVAYYVNADGSVSTGSVDGVKADSNITIGVYVKLVDNTTTYEIDTIYVVLK